MWSVNRVSTALFDGVFSVMETWPRWLSLSVLAAVTGVLAMIAYKYTSNQAAIGRVRDDLKASLLSLKLYKDELAVTFAAQGRLFVGAGKLFVHSLIPLAVMLVPMIPLITQSALRYEWRPLRPGEYTTLTATLAGNDLPPADSVKLDAPSGVTVAAGPSRAYERRTSTKPGCNEVVWRLRADAVGQYQLTVAVGSEKAQKELVVADRLLERASPVRPGTSLVDQILYPAERPATSKALIRTVALDLPKGSTPIFGWDIHWFVTYLIVSMVVALIFKPILKVKI